MLDGDLLTRSGNSGRQGVGGPKATCHKFRVSRMVVSHVTRRAGRIVFHRLVVRSTTHMAWPR